MVGDVEEMNSLEFMGKKVPAKLLDSNAQVSI
jgi:hypothetical protein